jgi:hypothetical protein
MSHLEANGGFLTFNPALESMERIFKGVIVLGMVFILFWALNTPSHWMGIILLLGIIFYALFANPLGKPHIEAAKSTLLKKKKKSTRKKK